MESEPDAIGMCVRVVVVVDTADVFYGEELEYIMYAYNGFHVRCLSDRIGPFGQHEEVWVVGVSR